MTKCSALNCKNIGVHLFPKDPTRRKAWENALCIKNFRAGNCARLCAQHFKENDYFGISKYTGNPPLAKFLKKTAVPSIFNFTKNTSQTPAATKPQQHCERTQRKPKKDSLIQTPSNDSICVIESVVSESTVDVKQEEEMYTTNECAVPDDTTAYMDYPDAAKVRRLKKTAVPTQNLPWQFPNKRVSPTLAKARMERLLNRSQQKSDSPVKTDRAANKNEAPIEKKTVKPKSPLPIKSESETDDEEKSVENISVELKLEKDNDIELKEEVVEENGEAILKREAPETKEVTQRSAPTRLRNRKGVLKCELCGRKCLTPQALQTHQQIAHKNARNNQFTAKKESPSINKNKSSLKPVPVALISVKQPQNTSPEVQKPIVKKEKVVERSLNESDLVEKVLQEDSDSDSSDSSANEEKVKVGKQDQTRTEFECPKCGRRFSVYFMAQKHMQKHHSGAQNGSKMSNQTPKPNRIEICTICNSKLDGTVHLCGGPIKLAHGYTCAGCGQEYKTLCHFDMHNSSMHSDGVQSMFFSTLDEFEHWKQKMETQTRVKYSILDQNDTKKVHRCMHRPGAGSGSKNSQNMCPSSVVVQEFTKGFQVHYYPLHYGHNYQPYTLGEQFKKYSISSLMSFTAKQLPDSEDEIHLDADIYLQFKKVTEVLVTEAARINVNGLKKLMRKALEMIAIVNSYVEDDDDDITTSKSIIKLDPEDDLQDQVKKALRSLKRKPNDKIEETPAKKQKPVFQSTENTPKAVRISNTVTFSTDEETENKSKPSTPKQSPQKPQGPSFMGTFQDFVGKKTIDKSSEKKKKPIEEKKKKTIVKTKIGQFKPSPPKKALESPTVKSPVSPRQSIGSVKEVKYEVKEQENDCNILILKI